MCSYVCSCFSIHGLIVVTSAESCGKVNLAVITRNPYATGSAREGRSYLFEESSSQSVYSCNLGHFPCDGIFSQAIYT